MIAEYKYSLYLLFVSLDKHPSIPLFTDICRCYLSAIMQHNIMYHSYTDDIQIYVFPRV